MSRLIDADELKKKLWSPIETYITGNIVSEEEIDETPTAYNLDKVIKQLEDLDVENQSCQNCKYIKECDDMQEKYNPSEKADLCAMLTRIKAIEIVKKGGSE